MFNVESQGAVGVVQITGPLNLEAVESLMETVTSEFTDGQPMVVVDMADVPLMDSAGLEALMDIRDLIHSKGGEVRLAAPNQLCSDILHVTGIGSEFDVHKEVKSAVRSFVQ